MMKILKGRICDTDTAQKLGVWESGNDNTASGYMRETLYRNRADTYFLHCEGNAGTPYGKHYDDGSAEQGETLRLLSDKLARQWAMEKLGSIDALKPKPRPSKDNSNVIGVRLPPNTLIRMVALQERDNISRTELIRAAIDKYLGECEKQ